MRSVVDSSAGAKLLKRDAVSLKCAAFFDAAAPHDAPLTQWPW